MDRYKTIGIIGGQGPASTIAFYDQIVRYFQDEFGARYVRDYPPMIIHSIPTPDLVGGVEDEERTFKIIVKALYGLERTGAEFIIITCISLQFFIERLQPLVGIPIVPITPILVNYAKKKGYKTVGVLATKASIEKKIFDGLMGEAGIRLVTPGEEDQRKVGEVVLDIIGGRITPKDKKTLKKVIKNLQKKEAEAILVGCTEFPLILKQSDVKIPLINCNELYPRVAAQYAAGRLKKFEKIQ